MSEQRKILVVANETLNGEELLDAVRKRVAGSDALVLVIAPVNAPREGYVVYENTRRAAAGRRLDKALQQLPRRGDPGFRARRRQRSAHRGEGRDRDGGARRARRLHASRGQVRLAAPQPARGDPEGGRRPSGRARGLGRRVAHGCAEHPRGRERDGARRAAARPDPREGARGRRGDELPDRLAAERSGPGRAPGGRPPAAPGARAAAVGGHRGARPGRASGSVHRGDARRPRREHRRHPRLHLPGAARVVMAAP